MKFEKLWHLPCRDLWLCEAVLKSNEYLERFLGMKRRNILFFSEESGLTTYMGKRDIEESAEFGLNFYKRWNNFLKTKNIMKNMGNLLYGNLERISELDFSKISTQNIIIEYKNILEVLAKQIASYHLTQPSFTALLEKEFIANKIVNKIIFSPTKVNPFEKSQIEIKKAALSLINKGNPNALGEKYWKKFYFVLGGLGQAVPTIQTIKRKIETESRKEKTRLIQEIQEILKEKNKLRKEIRRAEMGLNEKNKIQTKIIRELSYLRFTYRFAWTKAIVDIPNTIFRQLSKQLKTPLDYLLNIRSNELKEPIDKHLTKELGQRSQKFAYGIGDGKEILITDPKLIKTFFEKIKPQKTTLKGLGVSEGKVIGRVFVIKFQKGFEKLTRKMKKGDILVTGNTTPQMMPAVVKAKGIVAEEGGILSHASIVSRELKIPCVVGVKGILDNVQTGNKIRMDGKQGIVKLLKTK